jgi:hypothetical protein
MSGILNTPSMPGPDPELKAEQDKQEAQLEQQERTKMAQIAARRRARQIGGRRLLLSSTREDAEKGIQETLG